MKIAVITAIPTPYRDPFWNVLASQPGVELSVFYCAAGKNDRPWSGDWERRYLWEVLPGRNLVAWKGGDSSIYHNPSVVRRLSEGDFDAVLIGGYNHLTMLQAIRCCIRQGIPYFLMCESHLQKARSKTKVLLKDRLVRWVVANMSGGFPTGTLAEQYLLHYGARAETLSYLPNAPDVEKISSEAQRIRKNHPQLRRELGFSDRPTLLFVGRLIPKKGAHLIVEAMAKLQRAQQPDLVIVGDGPERASLVTLIEDHRLQNRVRFTGFVEPTEMVRWYVACDRFVLPSRETWGVVVSEALAAGMPVLVSDQVGCHPDTIGNHQVGDVLTRNDIEAWSAAIARPPPETGAVIAAWHDVYETLRYPVLAKNMLDLLGTASRDKAPENASAIG